MCKIYTGYCGTSEIEHGLCACTVDNPLAKARGLSLRTGPQTMLYLSLVKFIKIRPAFKLVQYYIYASLGTIQPMVQKLINDLIQGDKPEVCELSLHTSGQTIV